MSDQQNRQVPDQFAQVSGDLIRGLKACHSIVDDYRARLAANRNDPEPANEDAVLGDEEGGSHG